ncbi:MAG: protease inhibitor I42 family protein [Bacillota bacterium]
MKRAVWAVFTLVVLGGLVWGVGVYAGRPQDIAAASPGTIAAKVGSKHRIVLEPNPSTGYSWTASFDGKMLALVSQDFKQSSPFPGAPGQEILVFRAMKPGTTEVLLEYRCAWEDGVLKAERLQFSIGR